MGAFRITIDLCQSLESSDWINIIAIIINSFLALWIISKLQNSLTNKRVLKDHFINEIREIRNEYKQYLKDLYSDSISTKTIIPWFKLMNIKVNDTMMYLNSKYQIESNLLNPYQIELRELITENQEYITQFQENNTLTLSTEFKNELFKFEQNNNKLFNEIIVNINDAS